MQVFGPVKTYITNPAAINTSNELFRDILQGKFKQQLPATANTLWVDVRDVAAAHVAAFEKPEAAGQRFFVTSNKFSRQQVADIIVKNFPELKHLLPATREPNDGLEPVGSSYTADNSRSKKVLGIQYHTLEECVVDSIKALRTLGI